MIEHIWSVLCSNCLIDATTNTVSLIEVIEELVAFGPPFTEGQQGLVPVQCSLVSTWERRPADQPTRGTAKLRFMRPNGECSREQEYAIDISATQRSRTIAKISGITFRELGRHVFEIHLREDGATDWTKVASIPVVLSVQPPPAGTSQ